MNEHTESAGDFLARMVTDVTQGRMLPGVEDDLISQEVEPMRDVAERISSLLEDREIQSPEERDQFVKELESARSGGLGDDADRAEIDRLLSYLHTRY